ncbi:MAG: cation/multidrug efflux pump [Proteobacteria bacterium]|nr:cation/multidrug efflux pump [Pseudomonadota bacterium]MDA0994534.1 cation/multidrug efflux pump [Pseudomonadota bacterium]
MTILVIVGVVSAVLAIYFLTYMLRCVRRRHLLRAGGSCVSWIISLAVAGASGMLLLSYLSYGRLIDEQLVSRIEFRRISSNEFRATIMVPGKDDLFFTLRGDEWQMDAKIVTWKPPMTVLGLDPIYQLDRLSGRYAEIDRELTEARTVHSLTSESRVDIWHFARRFPILMPGVDAHYGTATYVPMADGARFKVTLSRDALIARPDNDKARDAIGAWGEN